MKISLLMVLCGAAFLVSGCAVGITRTGYQLPPNQNSKDLDQRPIAIQCNAKYDTNDVLVLGSIHAYDTGLSIHCDEATVLDIFRKEGRILEADLIDITEEKEPNPMTSTCYRAKATFLRFKDREKAKVLVSDAKYSPEEIAKRVAEAHKRNEEVIVGVAVGGVAGGAIGGLLAGAIVSGATDPNATNSGPASVQSKQGHR
ncbi:MAG: hypothetical protein WAO21_14980 [Verrucomicrobiia bacterium]